MPQLDFANPFTISQVVWMALIFAGLYFLFERWALPQVAAVLESRAHTIDTDLATARVAKEQADIATLEVTNATREANSEAQAAINTAIVQAKTEAAEQTRVANETLDAQLTQADERIATARATAMGALREVATGATADVVQRLTARPADPTAVMAAITAVMA